MITHETLPNPNNYEATRTCGVAQTTTFVPVMAANLFEAMRALVSGKAITTDILESRNVE